jgi:Tc5 transposase DNA-binding domain
MFNLWGGMLPMQLRSRSTIISDALLTQKAKQLSTLMAERASSDDMKKKYDGFHASVGWLSNFKKRNGIKRCVFVPPQQECMKPCMLEFVQVSHSKCDSKSLNKPS